MIYTIPASSSLVDLVARQILSEEESKNWGISKFLIILPTRRACKSMREAFLRESNGRTLLLPKITSLYDIDFLAPDIPEAISSMERLLLLMQLCQKMTEFSADKSLQLAVALASLLDEFYQNEIPLDVLQNVVPENLAQHWQETLRFLDIIKNQWPRILSKRRQIDVADRQIRVLKKLTAEWLKTPPDMSVFVVGFMGGLPSTEDFLNVVRLMPSGRVILPYLDIEMDDSDWNAVDETHPQFQLKKLLNKMDVNRKNIAVLGIKDWQHRQNLINASMKPAQNTHKWRGETVFQKSSIDSIRFIQCSTPSNEAFTIACELRRVLEVPSKTAMLVTPDRNLARRVVSEMKRWNVLLDDSAGIPLSKTIVGNYLLLLATAGLEKTETALLSALKHPLAQDGEKLGTLKLKIRKVEKQARESQTPLSLPLSTDLRPFFHFFEYENVEVSFSELFFAHIELAEKLAKTADRSGEERLWHGAEGEKMALFLNEIKDFADKIPPLQPMHYPLFFKELLSQETVRPLYGMNQRLSILGPIEARLQHSDEVIIGGVNEGTWPELPVSDLWLSRPMRQACGLPLLEEKIGIMAHDFSSLLMNDKVILTRSEKQDGTPTLPSRWILRLQALLEASHVRWLPEKEEIVSFVQSIDDKKVLSRPMPKPPLSARPKKLSITKIEEWMKDPYSIYARFILGIRKLEDLDEDVSLKDYGILVHHVLEKFLTDFPQGTDIHVLLKMGDEAFDQSPLTGAALAFWKPKFKRVAQWFICQQKERQNNIKTSYLEKTGEMQIQLDSGGVFTLTGKADRIDVLKDDSLEIIDYKTGTPPSSQDVASGFSPQLPLEGALLKGNSFADIQETKDKLIHDMAYWSLLGDERGGQIKSVAGSKQSQQKSEELVALAMEGLRRLISLFENEETPYVPCPSTKHLIYNDYEHLERLPEWITSAQEDDDL